MFILAQNMQFKVMVSFNFIVLFNLIMSSFIKEYIKSLMSSNFLQRFKGKTQTISKDGVHNVLGGGKGNDVLVYTNTALNINQKANTSKTSNLNPSKNQDRQSKIPDRKNQSMNKLTSKNQTQKGKQQQFQKKQKQAQNPFLISNPFYLDQEERERQEKQKREFERQQKLQRQMNKAKDDPKKGTYASLRKHSSQNRSDKEWVKLGGLGANIGGEQWEQKKKKIDKMQQFAQQVKAININSQKNRPPRPQRRQQKKDNARQKALQYSKNIPKPVIRQYRQQQNSQMQAIKQVSPNQLSELQMYELRHKQLKQMIRNQN